MSESKFHEQAARVVSDHSDLLRGDGWDSATARYLRNHLFETLEQLKDDEKPMDIARAKAVSDVAQTIINTAKVEIAFLDATGADTTGEFFDSNYRRGKALPQREKPRLLGNG